MTRMKAFELRKKTSDELATLLQEGRLRRDALYPLIRQKKTKNVREIRAVRRDIARITTLLRERKAPQ